MQSLMKGIPADINEDFLKKLRRVFSQEMAMWQPGEDVADVAFKAGQQAVLKWIEHNANRATIEAE